MSKLGQQPITILVIEDDPGDFCLIQANVRLAGIRGALGSDPVIWAKTLAERIRKADEQWAEEMYAVYDELQALIEEAKAPL